MIGKITVSVKNTGQVVEMVLHDSGAVECQEPLLKEIAETSLLIYNRNYSPASGPYGVGFLNNLARRLGGSVEIEPKQKHPPGTVY